MNNSVIFYESSFSLINPHDEVFREKMLIEINIENDKSVDDALTKMISDNLVNEDYTNILIPLCFGKVLSDFLGLRFASHIRCTEGINQCKNIFIYSFAGIKDFISNDCFDILKTSGTFLIDYNVDTIINQTLVEKVFLTRENLVAEVKKLNLHVPLNYEDNHSIANEWSIYRWSKIINASDEDIEKIEHKIENDLYFKYLKTIHPITVSDTLQTEELKINHQNSPKVLYIDDEAEKGWYEIFCELLYEKNKISFSFLDDEFNEKTRDEMIDISLKEIINEDIDLVFLDFRLHKDDFENISINEVTGYQILKKIKDYNKGIQVIVFSATNKIWNLQALQTAGADGFVIKESPENSTNKQFIKQSIQSFISITKECLNKRFLKYFFKTCEEIKNNINNTYSDPHSAFDNFKKELLVSLKIIQESASKIDLNLSSSLDVVFLNCYNFLEKFKHHYIKETGGVVVLGFDEIEVKRYSFNGQLNDEGIFIRNNINDNPSFFQAIISMLIEYFEILKADDNAITKVHEIKEARNNYIHGSKSNFNIDELTNIITICKTITINLKD